MTLRKTSFALALGLCSLLILGAAPGKTVKQSKVATQKTVDRDVIDQRQVIPTQPATVSSEPAWHLAPELLDVPLSSSTQAATYEIPWSSVNGGGAPSSSTNYSVNASVGQAAIGFATSTSYQAGIGYWYGAEAAGGGGCDCPFQCDMNADGQFTSVDLNLAIQVYFFNATDIQDPNCPATRSDFNADGSPNSVDLNNLIQTLFFNGPNPVDPCL